ncbi:MAG TPA: LysE family translocator [Acidiphilium sp.]
MFEPSLFLKAAGVGLAVAAPVGPMGVLCMRRTLARGWRQGFAIGCGIAVGDGTYGLVAALGLVGISRFMLAHEQPLHIAAGLFLIWLGLKTFWIRLRTETSFGAGSVPVPARGWMKACVTATLLTLTNPPTIIMFAALFAVLAPPGGLGPDGAMATVAGVFTGSLLWWCFLVTMVSGFRHAIGDTARRWIDRVAGMMLAAFGAAELYLAAAPLWRSRHEL